MESLLKKLSPIILILFTSILVSAQADFSDKTQIVIQTEALKLIEEYEKYINETGKSAALNIDEARSHSEELIELFINRQVFVANDLDPQKKLSKVYEIETYANNLILWYKDGININMWYYNAKVSNIIKHSEEVYSIDVYIPKKVNGNYMNKTLNTNLEKLIFRIAFTVKNGSKPANFKIAGIRDAESKTKTDSKTLNELNGQDFPESELVKIHSKINTLLNDYINYLTLISDPEEIAEDKVFYKERFMIGFNDANIMVANDLEEKPKEKTLSIKQYLEKYESFFPKGINNLAFNLDSAEYGKVMKQEKNKFYTYVYLNKFFSASPDGKNLIRNDNKLTVKIEFEQIDKAYNNFKISSIVNNQEEYANLSSAGTSEMPELQLSEASRKGLIIGAYAGGGLHELLSNDLLNSETVKGQQDWETSSAFSSYSAGAYVAYYFSNRIGLQIGAEYSTYSTTYKISGEYLDTENTYYTDVANLPYNKKVSADFDSTISLRTISVPLFINLHTSKAGKFGAFAKIGANFAFPLSAEYSAKGNIEQTALLQENQQGSNDTEIFDGPAETYRRAGETEGELSSISQISVSLAAKAGIEYYINYFLSIQAGVYFSQGITNIENNSNKYYNVFKEPIKHDKTYMQNKGVFFGISYKL